MTTQEKPFPTLSVLPEFTAIDRDRRLWKRQLTKLNSLAETAGKQSPVNVSTIEELQQEVVNAKSELDISQKALLALVDKLGTEELRSAAEVEIFNDSSAVLVSYVNTKGKITKILRKSEVSRASIVGNSSMVATEQVMPVKFPKIPIPEFSGDIRKFQEFKLLYKNIVHDDPSIPNVRKFWYLKDALSKGDAKSLLSDLEITEDAYEEAWNRLLDRYDNRRAIMRAHFRDLYSIKELNNEGQIRKLLDTVDASLRSLKLCKPDSNAWEEWWSFFVGEKLDARTRRDWENSVADRSVYPSYSSLKKFLEVRADFVDTTASGSGKVEKVVKPVVVPAKQSEKKSFTVSTTTKCPACGLSHLLVECKVFQSKTPYERFEIIRDARLCLNCFNAGHRADCCKKGTCKKCSKKHNTLLHRDTVSAVTSNSSPMSSSSNQTTTSPRSNPVAATESSLTSGFSGCTLKSKLKTLILPSALVRFTCDKTSGVARILIDSCSMPTLISENFIRRFKLRTRRAETPVNVKGIGYDTVTTTRVCNLQISSRFSPFSMNIEADVVPCETLSHAVSNLEFSGYSSKLKKLQLADPAFSASNVDYPTVDIIIGVEYFNQCILGDTKRIENLTCWNTPFGWVLSGAVENFTPAQPSTLTCNLVSNVEACLKKFWEIEEAVSINKDVKHDRCTELFMQSVSRNAEGRFVVRLPLKVDRQKITENRSRALNSLIRVEKSLTPEIRILYNEFMREYLQLEHMSLVPHDEIPNKSYYIPHRAVLRPSSLTTQCRTVFNATSHDQYGISLNEACYVGQAVQRELFDILIQFRVHQIAFVADVEKMYRQVLIHPEDRDLQRILWRENPQDPIQHYRLNTVTYGTTPASFLSTKCLSILGEELKEVNFAAGEAILQCFYMDDLLTGADSVENALNLQSAIHEKLLSAGFVLRKYVSNDPKFSTQLNINRESEHAVIDFSKDDSPVSVLGVAWNPKTDVFQIRRNLPPNTQKLTKRTLLSEISRIFDPLGFVVPITIRAKLLLQSVYRHSLQWDDEIPESIAKEYDWYRAQVPKLKEFQLPRCYITTKVVHAELVGFSDASDRAYCAVVYFRNVTSHGVETVLLCAKTKLAPPKEITIPRLELLAAVLLAKLMHRCRNVLRIPITNVFCFSDSQVVLAWLAKPRENWKVFVANRVDIVTTLVPTNQWSYVHTTNNPADLGTRGIAAEKFLRSSIWTNGPSFLSDPNLFNDPTMRRKQYNTEVECRHVQSFLSTFKTPFVDVINRISSYPKIIAVFSRIILLFRRNSSNNTVHQCNEAAKNAVFRIVQRAYYQSEIELLNTGKQLQRKSSLRSLNPFIDTNGLLRVGGRLQNSEFSYPKRHPLILPVTAPIVKVFVRHVHEKYYHATREFMYAFLSSEFWFVGSLRKLLKKVEFQCVACTRFRAAQPIQLMGPLPSARVTPSRPFSVVGVDLAGPLMAKCVAHRSVKLFKIWAVMFVCFSTRAVHIEICSTLSAEGFLAAFERFIAQRGIPHTVWSDNGTNFQAASKVISNPSVISSATQQGVTWRFIPPKSPHKGGLWEAAIKSAKRYLTHVTNGNPLSYEEYDTVFSRIEMILNSRPLCYRSGHDDEAGEILTPANFLIGSALYKIPELEHSPMKLSVRYNLLQQLLKSFWRRWSTNYISQLQTRSKWQSQQPNVSDGAVVFVKTDALPPGKWPLGRICAVYPDAAGCVRTVDVLYGGSIKRRPINSVVLLPVDD